MWKRSTGASGLPKQFEATWRDALEEEVVAVSREDGEALQTVDQKIRSELCIRKSPPGLRAKLQATSPESFGEKGSQKIKF